MLPKFADLTTISEGLETIRLGKDPLLENPTDALGRTVNYPRVWLWAFSALDVEVQNVWLVALTFCALYLLCASVLIARAKHAVDALILLLASLSVAPLLALERGNNDLFVFALAFLGCAVTNRYVKSLALGAAALLKVFPIAGMMMDAVRRPARQRMLALLSVAFVFLLFAWQWHDLSLMRLGTPVSRIRSFGFLSFQQEVVHFFPQSLIYFIQLPWILAGAFFFSVALTIDSAWKKEIGLDSEMWNSWQAEMFAVFGGIYAFSYAIGSSWDYRLIFLIPTLPLVLELARATRFRRWALAYLVLIGIAENALALEMHGGTLLVHLATFALFLLVLAPLTQQLKRSVVSDFAIAPSAVPSI